MKFIHPSSDAWRPADPAADAPPPVPAAHTLLSLAQWHALREHWPAGLPVGVTVPNTFDVEALAGDLPRLALVVLQFPKWTDGRAYSQAHVLRSRLRFAKEVRATGDVVVDMLPMLARCGADAVQLRTDQDEDTARRVLSLVTEHYQGDVRQTRPFFARIAA